ncbi:MAG: replicative DNA helicase [Porphyromonas sp.]|nr:replicative DNA helicase [Porphyromonas sp.]
MSSPEKYTTQYAYTDVGNEPVRHSGSTRSLNVPFSTSVPPNNIEVEQLVIGALLLERDAFSLVSEILTPDCFYDNKNKTIFEAILELELEEDPIDAQTTIEKLKSMGKLNGGLNEAYIATLVTQVNSTAHLEFHARLLFDKKLQRDLISFGNSVVGNAFDQEMPVTDAMQAAEDDLFKITQGADKDDVQPIKELIKPALDQIELASQRKEGISGIYTGFREIDQVTSGWHPSDLVIIAARPGMGKTAFVLSMARTMCVDYGIPVGIFSLEMSKEQLTNRLIVNHTEIPNDDIKRGNLSDQQLTRLAENLGTLESAPLYIDDNAGLSVFDLRTKARRLVRDEGVKIIIIDYLQLMTASDMKANANREQEVSTISRSLKKLAKDLNITVIALSQLNRGLENRPRESKRPQLADLRESGAIEQDADMVCFIHRPEKFGMLEDDEGRDMRGLAEFIIAKHRNGPTDTVYLRFQDQIIKFSSALDHDIYASGSQILSSNMNNGMGKSNKVDPFAQDDLEEGSFTI